MIKDLSHISAILFDVGHTLIYAHPSSMEIYCRVACDMGARVQPKTIETIFHKAFHKYAHLPFHLDCRHDDVVDREMWQKILFEVHESIAELQVINFNQWFETLYELFGKAETWRIYDDVEQALAKLRAKSYKLGIISNWDTRLRNMLDEIGLLKYFDVIIISSEVGVRKPDRKIFEIALSQLHVSADQAIHIGDFYEDDYLGATNAGLTAYLMDRNNENHREDVKTIGGLLELISI